ncbi:MAG: YceD family protein [Bacilli bacterium]|nr:YceD family protein [Bacilli bacterium]
MMNIDLTRLFSGIDEVVPIDINYSFSKEDLAGTDLLSLNNVSIKGSVSKSTLGDANIDINIDGVMVIPCSISLKPTNYSFSTNVSGSLLEFLKEIDENIENVENILDIFPIVWENILLEIPLKVVSDDIDTSALKGEGWQFVTEEASNTPLSQLQDLLK